MLRTLYGRMAVILLGLFCLMAILQVGVQAWSTQRYLLEASQRLNRNLAANLVSQGLIGPEGQVEQAALKEIFHTLMVVNPSIEVYLLDRRGEILTYSAPPGRVQLQQVDPAPIRAFLEDPDRLPVLGEDPRKPGEQTIFSAAPVTAGDRLQGYLYIILAGEKYRSAFEALRSSYTTRLSATLVVAAAVFVLVTALVLFGLLTRRLRQLSREVAGAPQVSGGATQREGDEVDRLERSFREMAARIQGQLATIRKADEERRTLVSNISHDLKTPLAAMGGHLETLYLKEDRLTPEERQRYLKIAVDNAKRLGRQVDELFDLARLDAPETPLRREAFPLADLLQDAARKFGVMAAEREVEIRVRTEPGLPFVDGDIGLVERCIDNLLKNAILHSPAETAVEVGLRGEPGAVVLEVTDHGPGIPEEDLPHLFQRFFRGRDGHGPSEGSGLGLAIVRRIAELHGGQVEARNAPSGGGAVFSLRLPVVGSS